MKADVGDHDHGDPGTGDEKQPGRHHDYADGHAHSVDDLDCDFLDLDLHTYW